LLLQISAGARSASLIEESLQDSERLAGGMTAWRGVFVQLLRRCRSQPAVVVPAVQEPLIVWVTRGTAKVRERELGGQWRETAVRPGQFFLTTAGQPYELGWETHGSEDFEVLHVYLGSETVENAALAIYSSTNVIIQEVAGAFDPTISSLLSVLRSELDHTSTAAAHVVAGVVQALVAHIVWTYAKPVNGRASVAQGGLPARALRDVLRKLNGSITHPFSLDELAGVAGVSPFHFSRAFKQSTGSTPLGYFTRLRLEHARHLLESTSLPVAQISLDVGYLNPSHFAALFRRAYGVTPARYRKAE
jgi:AraC family transcriptional regulator